MSVTVFKFSISDLNEVFGRSRKERNAKAKEIESLKERFEDWGLSHNATIALNSDTLTEIITDSGSSQTLVEWAEKLGVILKSLQLTTSQIRNVFGTVRQIEMNWGLRTKEQQRKQAARQLILLKPKLAYQAQREQGRAVQNLADVLTPAIDLVGDDRELFQNFVDFFEAILAYHTAAGGK